MRSKFVQEFANSLSRFPDHIALDLGEKTYTYTELSKKVAQLCHLIHGCSPENPFVPFLANREYVGYLSVLGILTAGKAYVPINPDYPANRIQRMLNELACRILIASEAHLPLLEAVISRFSESFHIICADMKDVTALVEKHPQHQFYSERDLEKCSNGFSLGEVDADSPAYLLYTSGSTGTPKGIPVSHANIAGYLENLDSYLKLNESDKVLHLPNLAFDASIQSMYCAWGFAGSLIPLATNQPLFAANVVRKKAITVWKSVPSIALLLTRSGFLKPNSFPSLRVTLFGGEPLPADLIEKWLTLAPNSIVENYYGPTEVSVAVTRYRWDRATSLAESRHNVVPIGYLFDGVKHRVLDSNGRPVKQGEIGELWLSGRQVTKGYFKDEEKSSHHYVRLDPSDDVFWYRTGDLVLEDEKHCFHYVDRVDDQVKVLGNRIELKEIDAVLQKVASCSQAISIAWPVQDGIAQGIASFICGAKSECEQDILNQCAEFLPTYMVPTKILFIDSFPLNQNGKIDRRALIQSHLATTPT